MNAKAALKGCINCMIINKAIKYDLPITYDLLNLKKFVQIFSKENSNVKAMIQNVKSLLCICSLNFIEKLIKCLENHKLLLIVSCVL